MIPLPQSGSVRDRRRRAGAAPPLAFAAVVAVTLVVGSVAADEDDWQVSARTGLASVVVEGRDPFGARLALDAQYGLTDAWAVRLTTAGSRHGVTADPMLRLPGGAIYTYSVFGGLSYTLDVLRLLPSFEVGIGVLGIAGAVIKPHRAVGMQAAVGADYLVTPRWSVGGVAEYVFAPFDLVSNALSGNAIPQSFALSIRGSWIIQ